MPGPFTIIRTENRNYWREGLESKEKTSSTKFCCGSRTGAAQGRKGCGKDGADAWNTLVRMGKRKGRREEALRSSPLLPGNGCGMRFLLTIYPENNSRNNRRDSRSPSSVNTTDLGLPTGSVM